jgi:hypothetical protein
LTTGYKSICKAKQTESDLGFVQLKAGLKHSFGMTNFYVMGEAGAAFAVTNGYDKLL